MLQSPVQSPVHGPAEAVQKVVQPPSAASRQEMAEPQGLLGVRLELAGAGQTRRAPHVEDNGLEPMTFWLPARRSPN